jgi:NADH-quinone oxidoreductase subunit B
MPFATACCGIELMATASSRYDIARFGMERMSLQPPPGRPADRRRAHRIKMMPVLQRIYQQMNEPRWVISMGACASTGGVFDTYAVVQGCDQFIPVDVYVPGCPPRPEQLLEGCMAIQRIDRRGRHPAQGPRREARPREHHPRPHPSPGAPAGPAGPRLRRRSPTIQAAGGSPRARSSIVSRTARRA